MKDNNYSRLLVLCKMFINETSSIKILINDLCDQLRTTSQLQNEILEMLLDNFHIEDTDFGMPTSFYHFIRCKKN